MANILRPIFSEFRGRTCLITGGSGLIGSSLALALKELGSNVIVLDKSEKSENLANGIETIVIDMKEHTEVKQIIESILNNLSINHLFNCVSLKPSNLTKFYSEISKYDFDLWSEVSRVNTEAVAQICGLVGNHMVENRFGTIINFASIYGSSMGADQKIYTNNDFNTPAVYSVSKGGIVALTKHLSALWGEYNVRSNVISPGGVYSNHTQEFVNSYSSRIPMRRMATVEEIVFPAIFLASDGAQYINGHELFVDGGLHAW